MTAQEILTAMTEDGREFYGIRCDRKGIETGTVLANSHQWMQDYQNDDWGDLPDASDLNSNPDHPYNEELGCWDDGELDGVCTIGITADLRSIEKALRMMASYQGLSDNYEALYLISGDDATEGYDDGELIIEDGTVVAVIK